MNEEAEPAVGVVERGQPLQELLHEGGGVFDEDGEVDQRHLLVLNTHTNTQVSAPPPLL